MDFFNISPLDNRYYDKVYDLRYFLSDFGVNKIRFDIELDYFKELVNYLHGYQNKEFYIEFTQETLEKIREIEKKLIMILKPIEYYIRERIL